MSLLAVDSFVFWNRSAPGGRQDERLAEVPEMPENLERRDGRPPGEGQSDDKQTTDRPQPTRPPSRLFEQNRLSNVYELVHTQLIKIDS